MSAQTHLTVLFVGTVVELGLIGLFGVLVVLTGTVPTLGHVGVVDVYGFTVVAYTMGLLICITAWGVI